MLENVISILLRGRYESNNKNRPRGRSGRGNRRSGVYINFTGDPSLKNINPGGSVWVFDLSDGGDMSTISAKTNKPVAVAEVVVEDKTDWSATVKHGAELYDQTCSHCHGVKMVTSGTTYELRTFPKDDKERFINSVTNGKGSMPAWGDKITTEEISAIYEYVIH